jgi:hypothetical protein
VIVVVVLVLAAGMYALLTRNDPRQAQTDAEREHVAEEFPLGNPVDFQSEFRSPPDP